MSRPAFRPVSAKSNAAAPTPLGRAWPSLQTLLCGITLLCSITLAFAVVAGANERGTPETGDDHSAAAGRKNSDSQDKHFAAAVAPVLVERCLACHGGDSVEGGYDIRTLAGIRRPGDSSVDPVVSGDPKNSELYRRLVTDDESELMPSGGPRLGADEIQAIADWITSVERDGFADNSTRLVDVALTDSQYIDPPAVYPRPLPVTALAAGSGDGPIVIGGYRELLIWRDSDAMVPQRLAGFHVYISAIALAADGRLAVAHGIPGRQGEVTLARLTDKGLADRTTLLRVSDVPAALAFAPSGDHLAMATLDGRLAVVNFASPREAAQGTAEPVVRLDFTPHADAIVALAWSADGKHVLTASRDRTARVIRLEDGRATSSYAAHDRAVHGVSQIRMGTLTLDETGSLKLWAAGSRNPMLTRPRASDATLGMQRFEDTVLVPRSDRILRISVEQVEQDDGTDKDGKPKKKKVPRWKDLTPLQIESANVIVSLAVAADGTVLAGTHAGKLYRWPEGATAENPQSEMPLLAQPR